VHQSKLMAGNGLVHTLASVVSPAAGALLVAKLGFTTSFTILGWLLIATGLLAIPGVKERKYTMNQTPTDESSAVDHHGQLLAGNDLDGAHSNSIPWLFFLVPLAISCSQGILFFELPLIKAAQGSILTSGIFFSMVSLGALCTLSLLFLNRVSAFIRTICGSFALALIFFGMAVHWPIPLFASLFLIGMAKGIIFPALAALLASITRSNRYGRIFSLLSISFSIGAFIGPVLAGYLRDQMSSYFIAFFMLMLALVLLPLRTLNIPEAA
jgi:hypothetical protein